MKRIEEGDSMCGARRWNETRWVQIVKGQSYVDSDWGVFFFFFNFPVPLICRRFYELDIARVSHGSRSNFIELSSFLQVLTQLMAQHSMLRFSPDDGS